MAEPTTKNPQTRKLSWAITAIAVVLAIAHLAAPDVKIDAITVTLLVIAVLPWLGTVFRSLELPGGLKVEYHELERAKKEAEEAGLLAPAAEPTPPVFLAIAEQDPNLALAGLRIELEKRLRVLATADGIAPESTRQGIGPLLRMLASRDALKERERSVLADLIATLNSAVHGAEVDPRAAQWAMDVGPKLLRTLDERIASRGQQ